MKRNLVQATLTLLAGTLLAQAIPLLLGPALTRLYSPSEFGQFAIVCSLAANLVVVACARYELALPLESSEPRALCLLALCIRLLAAISAASAVAAIALAHWHGMPLAWALPWVVFTGGAIQCLTMWATRSQRFGWLAAARLLQHGGGAVIQLVLGLMKIGTAGLLIGPIVAGLGAVGLLLRPAPAGGWAVLWRQPFSALKAMAVHHRAFPIFNTPHALMGALQDTLVLLLLAAWMDEASAGFWALSLRYLKAPATLVGGALSQTLYPRLLEAGSPVQARALVRQTLLILALLAIPMTAVLLIWGPVLFTAVFGERWGHAGSLAQAMALYIGVHFIASPLSVTTLAWNAQGWALRLSLAGQAVFFLGFTAGWHGGGLIGAAWGVSLCMLAYFAYYFWALAHWNFSPHESFV